MLVFHSAPLPNALLYGMGEYHHFKNSKYCSVSLIMGRHYSKQFTFISSSPHNSPVRYVLLLSLLYRWGTQGREKANNQPKVTELTSSRAGANPRVPAGMHATMAGGGGWILKGVDFEGRGAHPRCLSTKWKSYRWRFQECRLSTVFNLCSNLARALPFIEKTPLYRKKGNQEQALCHRQIKIIWRFLVSFEMSA